MTDVVVPCDANSRFPLSGGKVLLCTASGEIKTMVQITGNKNECYNYSQVKYLHLQIARIFLQQREYGQAVSILYNGVSTVILRWFRRVKRLWRM